MCGSPLERGGRVCYLLVEHTPANTLSNAPPLERGFLTPVVYVLTDNL